MVLTSEARSEEVHDTLPDAVAAARVTVLEPPPYEAVRRSPVEDVERLPAAGVVIREGRMTSAMKTMTMALLRFHRRALEEADVVGAVVLAGAVVLHGRLAVPRKGGREGGLLSTKSVKTDGRSGECQGENGGTRSDIFADALSPGGYFC